MAHTIQQTFNFADGEVLLVDKPLRWTSFDVVHKNTYTGVITLGATTPSYDLEQEIDRRFDLSSITDEQIFTTAKSFVGEIEQLPPAHSAVKVDGERVYEKARRGETIVVKPRK